MMGRKAQPATHSDSALPDDEPRGTNMTRIMRHAWPVGLLAIAMALVAFAGEQNDRKESRPGHYQGYSPVLYDGWKLSSLYVPVRDGTRLAVDVIRPTLNGKLVDSKLPVIWMHTPYNRRPLGGPSAAETYPSGPIDLVRYGYVVAVVDFRGLYASFGTDRLYNFGNYVQPAWNDAYDITEWLARQPWSTGKIGMWGCSATGGSQQQAASTAPPSLKAIFPLSPNYDNYEFVNAGGVTTAAPYQLPSAATRDAAASPVDGPDGARLLEAAKAEHVDDPINQREGLPFRDSQSPVLGDWWTQSSAYSRKSVIERSGIATYNGGNWDESATKAAAALMFGNMPAGRAKLIFGPHGHCQWKQVAEQQGFNLSIEQLRFFDYWLKGIDNGIMSEPAVTYYTYNAPAGHEWRQSQTWPLTSEQRTAYYLGDGTLAPAMPSGERRVAAAMGKPGEANSISLKIGSPSISFDSQPLEHDTEVTGYPVVHLWIDSNAPDADAVAQLLDVAPDGSTRSYQMIGRLRASHRALGKAPYNDFGLPFQTHLKADQHPLIHGVPAELEFALYPISYIFPEGHRIRVALSFSNPNGGDGQVDVLTGGATASSVTLPLIPSR